MQCASPCHEGFVARNSSFRSGEGDSLDKMLLGEEKQNDRRNNDNRLGRHEQVPLRVIESGEFCQAEGQGELVRIIEIHQRTQKIVPSAEGCEDRNSNEGRTTDWDDDMPEDL